jgi:hypothetical protein
VREFVLFAKNLKRFVKIVDNHGEPRYDIIRKEEDMKI